MRKILRFVAVLTTTMATICASGQASPPPFVLRFPTGQATIDWNNPHNQQVRQEINQYMSQVRPEQVDTVYITSGMSPEGNNRINLLLAVNRTIAARSFLCSTHRIAIDRIAIQANWQMWHTMIQAIKDDPDIPQKQNALDMIDKPCESQEAINQTLAKLKEAYPETYVYVKENIFPTLCTSTIQIKLK